MPIIASFVGSPVVNLATSGAKLHNSTHTRVDGHGLLGLAHTKWPEMAALLFAMRMSRKSKLRRRVLCTSNNEDI
jgi:hypothetical protein